MDREKVIKALEYCVLSVDCQQCEYWMEFDNTGCKIMKDALAIIKEQKATQNDGYNLQELWKRARAGETLNETELNFLLADWDERNIFKQQEAIDEMVKPTKCPCGELFDAKDSSFCPKCGCAYGELSGRYTNIGR